MKQLLLIFLVFVIEGFVLWGISQIKTSSTRYLAYNADIAIKAGAVKTQANKFISHWEGRTQLSGRK
jgi:hypothetical protein